MILRNKTAVEEYDTNGKYVRSFELGIKSSAQDVTFANDGLLMVVQLGDPVFTYSVNLVTISTSSNCNKLTIITQAFHFTEQVNKLLLPVLKRVNPRRLKYIVKMVSLCTLHKSHLMMGSIL